MLLIAAGFLGGLQLKQNKRMPASFHAISVRSLMGASYSCLVVLISFRAFAQPLFDGESFVGWEGDIRSVWRIDNGEIIGGSLEKKQQKNNFLCTTKRFENFDLRLKIKLSGISGFVNSGIQFRSERIPDSHEVIGYQADFGHGYDGALYDESRRQKMLAVPPSELLRKISRPGEWHDYRIRANGNRIQIWINGFQTVDFTEQEQGLPAAGIIGLQIHGNAIAEVRFKDIVIEELPSSSGDRSCPPNVLFILADDLGYQELGCYGQRLIKTPKIDGLAEQGMRLTRHYAGNAVCAPSRCVLLTGKHPGHAFIRDNRSTPPEGQLAIPDGELTIAEVLKTAGFTTGIYGKWGLGGPDSTGAPLRQGFDYFFGYNCQAHAHSYYPSYLWDNTNRIPLRNVPPVPGHAGLAKNADPNNPHSYTKFKGSDYAPDRINSAAIDFLKTNRQRPFFLYYASTLPHVALHIPDEELEPYLALGWTDPPFTRSRGGYTPHFTPRAAYAAMISRLDKEVGALLDTLDELGLTDNTLVIFTSDNGTTHLRDEVDYDFFSSVGDLRGLKGSLYEGGVRVPCIIRWPGKITGGSQSDFLSGFEDWLPTILTAAGLPLPDNCKIDGRNILPALIGQPIEPRESLYREFPGYGGQQALWTGRWKAVRQKLRHGKSETELYDLEADPNEAHNVAATQKDIVSKLESLMTNEHDASKVFPLVGID